MKHTVLVLLSFFGKGIRIQQGRRIRAVMLNETIEGIAIGISDEGMLGIKTR